MWQAEFSALLEGKLQELRRCVLQEVQRLEGSLFALEAENERLRGILTDMGAPEAATAAEVAAAIAAGRVPGGKAAEGELSAALGRFGEEGPEVEGLLLPFALEAPQIALGRMATPDRRGSRVKRASGGDDVARRRSQSSRRASRESCGSTASAWRFVPEQELGAGSRRASEALRALSRRGSESSTRQAAEPEEARWLQACLDEEELQQVCCGSRRASAQREKDLLEDLGTASWKYDEGGQEEQVAQRTPRGSLWSDQDFLCAVEESDEVRSTHSEEAPQVSAGPLVAVSERSDAARLSKKGPVSSIVMPFTGMFRGNRVSYNKRK